MHSAQSTVTLQCIKAQHAVCAKQCNTMQFVQCIALLHNALRRQMVGIRPLPWVLLGLPCPPSMIGPHKSWMISNFPIQILFRVGSMENVIWGKFS